MLATTFQTQPITPLDFAVKSNSTEAVRFLLDKGSDPHTAIKDGSTPLHHAIIECWGSSIRGVVDLLLDKGADPCAPRVDGRTPLHLLFDSVRDVQRWQTRSTGEKKHKDDEDTDSSLKTSILKKFVRRRAVTDHVGPNGLPLLHQVYRIRPWSSLHWIPQALTIILERGASLASQDPKGRTALETLIDY